MFIRGSSLSFRSSFIGPKKDLSLGFHWDPLRKCRRNLRGSGGSPNPLSGPCFSFEDGGSGPTSRIIDYVPSMSEMLRKPLKSMTTC